MGFFGSLLKIGAGVVGTVIGGPAGGIAAFTAVSKATSSSHPQVQPPPMFIAPTPPPNFNANYLGGSGAGPINSYAPVGSAKAATRAPVKLTSKMISSAARKKPKAKAKPKKKAVKRKTKLKFGSKAYRAKYLGH